MTIELKLMAHSLQGLLGHAQSVASARVNCGAKYFGKAMISQARSASAKAAAYPISTPSYSSAPPNSPTRQPSFAVWLVK